MEPVQHRTHARQKKNTAKTNITISVIFHAVLFLAGAYWAAREGVLGKKLQTLSAQILDKEKKVETKKEAPKEEAKEQPKIAEVVKAAAAAAPPPAFVAPAAVGAAAPPPPVTFGVDLGLSQDALTGGDPIINYKQSVEGTLRARWDRPTDIDDSTFVAEIELAVDPAGKVLGHEWKKGSGDKRWDDSVKKVMASMKAFSRPPPKGFPDKVMIRFDTEAAKTEPVLQAGSQ